MGLNSIYKDMVRIDNNSNAIIYQADATYVNGRIRGVLKNTNNIDKKYIEVEIYSKRNILMGRKYIEIRKTEGGNQAFEVLFRAKDAENYKLDLVNEKKEGKELEIIPKELSRTDIIAATVFGLLIFW